MHNKCRLLFFVLLLLTSFNLFANEFELKVNNKDCVNNYKIKIYNSGTQPVKFNFANVFYELKIKDSLGIQQIPFIKIEASLKYKDTILAPGYTEIEFPVYDFYRFKLKNNQSYTVTCHYKEDRKRYLKGDCTFVSTPFSINYCDSTIAIQNADVAMKQMKYDLSQLKRTIEETEYSYKINYVTKLENVRGGGAAIEISKIGAQLVALKRFQ